jgi:hypothetical protein
MASPTRITRLNRKTKKAKQGARRKKDIRNKGTTPKFAIHQE